MGRTHSKTIVTPRAWAEPLAATDPSRKESMPWDTSRLFKWAHGQIERVKEAGADPKHLILGPDFYAAFSQEAVENHFAFSIPPFGGLPVGFAGLNVHCIPWMWGAVCLPELHTSQRSPIRSEIRERDRDRER